MGYVNDTAKPDGLDFNGKQIGFSRTWILESRNPIAWLPLMRTNYIIELIIFNKTNLRFEFLDLNYHLVKFSWKN